MVSYSRSVAHLPACECVPARYLYHLDKFAFKSKLRRGDHAGVDELSGSPHFMDQLWMILKLQ